MFWKRSRRNKDSEETKKTKLEVLKEISFGRWVAEREQDELDSYFLGTGLWNEMLAGTIDIVFGAKGAGKSALASQLSQSRELGSKKVFVIFGENPQGKTAFQEVAQNPPSNEEDFQALWKLHLLTLTTKFIQDRGFTDSDAGRRLVASLEKVNLSPVEPSLIGSLRAVQTYISSVLERPEVEVGTKIDPPVGTEGSVVADDISPPGQSRFAGADDLLRLANAALEAVDHSIWVILDRLDVAFNQTTEIEEDAIRALIRVHLDMVECSRLKPKIFLRSDIWELVTKRGFREATHFTERQATIKWTPDILLHVVVRRALANPGLCDFAGITNGSADISTPRQLAFLSRILPDYIERRSPFEWILTNTCDALSPPMPRELIHLFSLARQKQIEMLEMGSAEPDGTKLFSPAAFVEALQEVSKSRLEQMLFAEYPFSREPAEKLRETKNLYSRESLGTLWRMELDKVDDLARRLVQTGFFAVKLDTYPRYQISPIYRQALGVISP